MSVEVANGGHAGGSVAAQPALREGPRYSVIITCYFEQATIDEFHRRLTSTLTNAGISFEIVFVNDGSSDGTLDKLRQIFARDRRVAAVVDLFRNAGQAAAITAGIELARGRHFVFLDSDLQLDPESLVELIAEFETGYDIVGGRRARRQDSLPRRVASSLANVVMRAAAGHPLRDFGCTFRVIDGRLIRAFGFGPRRKFQLVPVIARAGRCREVPVPHHPRPHGRSGWSIAKLHAYFIENLVVASRRPFQLLSLACGGLAALFITRVSLAWIFDFSIIDTVTNGLILNVLVVNLLVMLAVLSALGEYVIRSFMVLQGHPQYVVRDVLQRPWPGDTSSSTDTAGERD